MGLTIFLTACAILVFYDTFYMGGTLQSFMTKLMHAIAPVLNGFAMAYLLAPVVNGIESLIGGAARETLKDSPKKGKLLRLISITLTWALVLLLVYLLMVMLIPQLVESITVLINNAESYYNKVYEWVNGLFSGDSQVGSWLSSSTTTTPWTSCRTRSCPGPRPC